MIIGKSAVILCLTFPMMVSALAQTHKAVDIRNSSDEDGQYEIGFCARPSPDSKVGLPGHVFVTFSHLSRERKRDFLAIGHTTSAAVGEAVLSYRGLLGSVSGYLDEERYSSVLERCLVVKVNKGAYLQAFKLTASPLAGLGLVGVDDRPVRVRYSLGAEDCMSFMIDVAKSLGPKIKIPERRPLETPMPYLRRFIDSN